MLRMLNKVSHLMSLPNMDGRVGREDEVLPAWPPLVPTKALWYYKLQNQRIYMGDMLFLNALKEHTIDPVLLGADEEIGDYVIEGNNRIAIAWSCGIGFLPVTYDRDECDAHRAWWRFRVGVDS